jgi:predicted secreted protein
MAIRYCSRPLLIASLALGAGGAWAAEPAMNKSKPPDPSEKICETHQVLGSRLAVRRVCGTRADWEDRRRRERDIIDRSQTQLCVPNPATGLCG